MFLILIGMIAFTVGFYILFFWLKKEQNETWPQKTMIASAIICGFLATILFYAMMGLVMFVVSVAFSFIIMVAIIVGGVNLIRWLGEK